MATLSPLKVEQVQISLLKPSKWNPNVVSPANEAKLEESLKRHGFFKPALVRTLADGGLEIVGGEHRIQAAQRLGFDKVPVLNLGVISDKKAQELCLLDNGRYGTDDTLQLAEILEGLGSSAELSTFMPYSDSDLSSIFSSVNISLDDLSLPDEPEEKMDMPREKQIQSHSVMRFKVPVDDVKMVTDLVERVCKAQKFTDDDSLTNVGDALVFICKNSTL